MFSILKSELLTAYDSCFITGEHQMCYHTHLSSERFQPVSDFPELTGAVVLHYFHFCENCVSRAIQSLSLALSLPIEVKWS